MSIQCKRQDTTKISIVYVSYVYFGNLQLPVKTKLFSVPNKEDLVNNQSTASYNDRLRD